MAKRVLRATIERGPIEDGWQDIDIILPGVGTLVLQRQGDVVTDWGVTFDAEHAFATLTGERAED